MRRFISPVVAIALVGIGFFGAHPRHISAQPALSAAMERPASASPARRAELYRLLEKQTEALQKQAAVMKLAAKLIGPTVVYIEADLTRQFKNMPGRHIEEAGSGVIVLHDRKYHVLTNRHVVKAALPEDIKIKLADGRQIHPSRIWEDPSTDIAVMAIDAPDLVAARLGDSDKMEVGDFVLAVGSPFGLTNSVTFGIISAKGRRDLKLGDSGVRFQDFLQTDASINPGNSGGPLINLRGEVIGINSAIASNSGRNEGIGFSIPINMFMIVAKQLVDQGKVARAFLGVTLDPQFGPAMAVEVGLPRLMGARITGVTPDSPAAATNLQTGDVILKFEGIPIEDDSHLINLVSLTPIGKKVSLLVFRDGKMLAIQAEVGDRSDFQPEE